MDLNCQLIEIHLNYIMEKIVPNNQVKYLFSNPNHKEILNFHFYFLINPKSKYPSSHFHIPNPAFKVTNKSLE